MIDIKFITENPDQIREGLNRKKSRVDLDQILKLSEQRNEKIQTIEALRAKQNASSKGKPTPEQIQRACDLINTEARQALAAEGDSRG